MANQGIPGIGGRIHVIEAVYRVAQRGNVAFAQRVDPVTRPFRRPHGSKNCLRIVIAVFQGQTFGEGRGKVHSAHTTGNQPDQQRCASPRIALNLPDSFEPGAAMTFLILVAVAVIAYFAWRIVDQLPDIVYRLSEIQQDVAELRRRCGDDSSPGGEPPDANTDASPNDGDDD